MTSPVDAEKDMLTVPIKLRDQVIGTLNIRPNTDGRTWSTDEVNIVQAITERLGLALDNARLFEETSCTRLTRTPRLRHYHKNPQYQRSAGNDQNRGRRTKTRAGCHTC